MTAFVINSGGVVEWESLVGASSNATVDSYTISNKSTLRIAVDSYICTNRTAANGTLENVNFTEQGGVLHLDGTKIRVIPFDTGVGVVPAIGTSITQGVVSGALLGVWQNWQSEPTAVGAAMPTSGWIKIKEVTGGTFTSGSLTGISASATGPDVVGWIEIKGTDSQVVSVPRVGLFKLTGEWFELGSTSGVRGQVLQCPTTGTIAGIFPGIWIETAPSSGVYEHYMSVGSLPASSSTPTDQHRGKVFWQTTSGIVLGSDGTNNVGYLPAAGCKVRIPNVICTTCARSAAGASARNIPNSTLGTRFEFSTGAAGVVEIDKSTMYWYLNILQPTSVLIKSTAIASTLLIQEVAQFTTLDDIQVGVTQSQSPQSLNLAATFSTTLVKDSSFGRYQINSGTASNQIANCQFFTLQNVKFCSFVNRSSTGRALNITNSSNFLIDGIYVIASTLGTDGSLNFTVKNHKYSDVFQGVTLATGSVYAYAASGSADFTYEGHVFPVADNSPLSGLMQLTSCYRWKVRNIASPSSRLVFGPTRPAGSAIVTNNNNTDGKIQRVYVSGVASATSSLAAFNNNDKRISIENCATDDADNQVIAATEATLKSIRGTPSTTVSSAVFGTHFGSFFTSDTAGTLIFYANEPTQDTEDQLYVTSGSVIYNGNTGLLLNVIGDQVTWSTPYWVKGYTSFANIAPSVSGTTTTNFSYEYQLDTGLGYGAWKTLNTSNLTGETLSSPSVGFKMKIRATCIVANTSSVLNTIRVFMVNTLVSQSELYPLNVSNVTIEGLIPDSEVRAFVGTDPSTAVEIGGVESSTDSFTFSQSNSGAAGYIQIVHLNYQPVFLNLTYSDLDISIPVQQQIDRNYQS
jgi:hypothetical protein